MIENLASAPCRHARAASEIVREYFDSDRSSPGCAPTPSTASQRTDALRALSCCTGASGGNRPADLSARNAAAEDKTSLIQLPDAFGMKTSVD